MADATLRITAIDATRAGIASAERSLKSLQNTVSQLGNVLTAGLGAGALVGFGREIVRATVEAEKSSARLNAILRNVGDTVGRTREDIEKAADSISANSIFDDDAVREAAAQLLVFRNVQREVFDEVLALAPDVAAFFGEELPQAAQELGRAFNAPADAARLLKRAGVDLRDTELELLKIFEETGRQAEAQRYILERLQGTFKGTSDEINQGMTKATVSLTKAWDDLLKAMGNSSLIGKPIAAASDALARFLKDLEQAKGVVETMGVLGRPLDLGGALGLGQQPFDRGPVRAEGAIRGAPNSGPNRAQVAAMLKDAQAAAKRAQGGKKGAGEKADPAEALLDSLRRQKGALQDLTHEEQIRAELQDKRYKDLTKGQRDAAIGAAKELDALERQKDAVEELYKAERAQQESAEKLARERQEELEREAEAREKLLDQSADEAESIRKLIDPTREFRQEMERVQQLGSEGFLNEDEVAKAQQVLGDRMQAALKKGSDGFEEFKSTVASATEDAIVHFKDLGNVLNGLMEDITRIAVRKGIVNPLMESLFGGGNELGGLAGNFLNLFKGGGGGAAAGGFTGFATGGGFTVGGSGGVDSQLVAFRATPGEQVLVAPPGRGAGGAVINMTVVAQDVRSFQRSQQQIMSGLARGLDRARGRA